MKIPTLGPSSKVNLNVEIIEKPKAEATELSNIKVIRGTSYNPSTYKSDTSHEKEFQSDNEIDLLKREKHDMQAQFFIEKQEFLTKISTLEEEILMKKHEIVEVQNKLKQAIGTIRDDHEINSEKYQKDVQMFKTEILHLEQNISKKEHIIKELSKNKDVLHQQLGMITEFSIFHL